MLAPATRAVPWSHLEVQRHDAGRCPESWWCETMLQQLPRLDRTFVAPAPRPSDRGMRSGHILVDADPDQLHNCRPGPMISSPWVRSYRFIFRGASATVNCFLTLALRATLSNALVERSG